MGSHDEDAERNLEKNFFKDIDNYVEERRKHYEKDDQSRVYVREEHQNEKDRNNQKRNNESNLNQDKEAYYARLEVRVFENYGGSYKAFKQAQKEFREGKGMKDQFNRKHKNNNLEK